MSISMTKPGPSLPNVIFKGPTRVQSLIVRSFTRYCGGLL